MPLYRNKDRRTILKQTFRKYGVTREPDKPGIMEIFCGKRLTFKFHNTTKVNKSD
jgi:hypothetical protein